MFRNVSATVLTLCLVPAASALAQSATSADPAPPQPPAHHEGMERGMHGPGGPGGFRGPMMNRGVAPVANAPFSATFTETASMENREGKQVQRSTTRTVYRDSLGRTREDVTLPPPPPRTASATQESTPATPPAPRVVTVIVDPVASTITRLNAERKTAFVETVPADFFKHEQKGPGGSPDGGPRHDHGAAVTDLGSKTIAGVVAQGKKTTHSMPGREGDSARTATRESWFSSDLKLEVSETDTTPRGTRTETVTSLTKAEPAAALFKVPDGYAVKQAPEHPFRSHGGGEHGDPNGSGPDGPPPPPPAM